MENITNEATINKTWCVSEFLLKTGQYNFSGELADDGVQATPAIEFIFNGLGLLCLTVVGITANTLSAIVLSHPKLKSSWNTLLLGLTISDIIVIVTSFLIFCISALLGQSQTFEWYQNVGKPFLIPWLLPIALTAQMSSVYFTVVITLERYIAVCLPFRARSLCTRTSAKWSSAAVILFSIVYNIPRWFEFKVEPSKVDCVTGEALTYGYWETDFRTEFFVTYYVNWAYLVFMYIVPFSVLFYFNAAIFKQARVHRAIRKSLSPSSSITNQHSTCEDIQLASMLFGIVITFIACNMLAVAINVIEYFGKIDWIGNLIPISNFLIVLACSTNFVFYCIFGTEFRNRLGLLLRSASSRKTSCTRSEIWTEKEEIVRTGRQLPNGGGRSKSLSVSSCQTGGNNNCIDNGVGGQADAKGKRSHSVTLPCEARQMDKVTSVAMPSRDEAQSTDTLDTVITNEI